MEHSSEDGPIWEVDLQTVANDWVPSMRERTADIEQKLLGGELPMALAMGVLNTPLSRVLLAKPPAGVRDGRHRPVVPIVSGARGPIEIDQDWTVGLDLTSILVLAQLGLLDCALEALKHVKVACDLMGCLFAERAAVRFHQPARVRSARKVKGLIDRGRLKLVGRSSIPARDLAAEVGADLATMLEAMSAGGGVTICARPIPKAGSLREATADTSAFDDLILSPADLCEIAHRAGIIDAGQFRRAKSFLASQGQVARDGLRTSSLGGPIYVDHLALSYLQYGRVLEPLANSRLDLRIHPNVAEEMNAVIEAGEAGDELAGAVESVRESLRRGMTNGKVSLLTRPPETDREGLGGVPSVISIEGLMFGADECDALCIDDRFTNSHPVAADRVGKPVPIVCVLDVLRYLRAGELIPEAEYWGVRHQLREAGFAFVPVEAAELRNHLLDAEIEDGRLLESAELRTIRQTVNRFAVLARIKDEEARALSQGLLMSCVGAIRDVWLDTSVGAEVAATLSTWVWQYLTAATYTVRDRESGDQARAPLEEVISHRVGLLMLAPALESGQRRLAYREWLDGTVIGPLKPSNPQLIVDATSVVVSAVDGLDPEVRAVVGRLFLECLPDGLQARLANEYPAIAKDSGLAFGKVMAIAGQVRVWETELVGAAKRAFEKAAMSTLSDLAGSEVRLDLVDDARLELDWTRSGGERRRMAVPALTLVCEEGSFREKAAKELLGRFGGTASGECQRLLKQAGSRKLSNDELSVILGEEANGVAAVQWRLARKIKVGWEELNLDDLVPSRMSYWERFCGPVPSDEGIDAYLAGCLVPYRRGLIEDDIAGGLDICCLGALRDDLSPGLWVEDIDGDTLLKAVGSIQVGGSPMALLGLLDIAVHRVEDKRFKDLAEWATRMLLDERLGFAGDYDGFRFFELLVDFVMNRLGLVEGVGQWPAFWRRMCAWMQAGLIVRTSVACGGVPDIDEFEKWSRAQMVPSDNLRRLPDCREEPMVLGQVGASGSLRWEVALRVGLMKGRHVLAGREVPMATEIDGAVLEVRQDASKAVPAARGPAEFHLLPENPVSDEIAKVVADTWAPEEPSTLSGLAAMSQAFVLGARERAKAREAVGSLISEGVKYGDVDGQLYAASVVACTTGDTEIADSVASVVARLAWSLRGPSDVERVVHVLMLAASARRDAKDWSGWLGEQLRVVAERIPSADDCAACFLALLEWMEVALPVRLWPHGGAQRVATAALEATP
ncbi:MAG: hypothetical protein F4Y26_00420 [Gammaproteobacteria bacterium]|nr:hypothetical protein [Gammaproteobacteria bacterium]